MQYLTLKEQLKDFIVFSLSDIRKVDASFYRPRLNEWQAKGYIKKLRRGYYMFADCALNEQALFLMANKLYMPSYVSLEMALSYYGLIPEGVYALTSVSTKKTVRFKTSIAEFSYKTMKPSLFFGYDLQKYGQTSFKIAEIEKAFLDYVYFHPSSSDEADFHEWRFNSREFLSRIDHQKLQKYLEAFNQKRLTRRVKKLIKLMEQERA